MMTLSDCILLDAQLAGMVASNDRQVSALIAMRQSTERSTKGSAVRQRFARALRASRAYDQHTGGRFGGLRYMRSQSGR